MPAANLRENYQTPGLRLVPPLPRSSAAAAAERILDRPRCRPGELPVAVRTTPRAATSEALTAQARELGISVELWARLVVDSEHVLVGLEPAGTAARTELVSWLDRQATRPAVVVEPLPGPNVGYVRALRARRGGSARASELELLVPEDMAGAWRLAAIAMSESFEAWLEMYLARTPQGAVVAWEIAAAEQHLSLREWCYAASARR